jgi:putative membrane protein insertion efficiency factor
MRFRDLWIAPLKGYKRFVSPWLPPACRFTPSCADYAMAAIDRHGVARGLLLAVWRIVRCNPLSAGGFDPPA